MYLYFSKLWIFFYCFTIEFSLCCRFGNLIPSFQSLQLGAALGLVRLALIVGLINQPLTGTNIPEDVVNRQVVHACINHFIFTIRIHVHKKKCFLNNIWIFAFSFNYHIYIDSKYHFGSFFFSEIFTLPPEASQFNCWWVSFH